MRESRRSIKIVFGELDAPKAYCRVGGFSPEILQAMNQEAIFLMLEEDYSLEEAIEEIYESYSGFDDDELKGEETIELKECV